MFSVSHNSDLTELATTSAILVRYILRYITEKRTLYIGDALWVREISLDGNLDIVQRREPDSRPDVIRDTLLEKYRRVGRDIPRQEYTREPRDIVCAVRVRHRVRVPGGGRLRRNA